MVVQITRFVEARAWSTTHMSLFIAHSQSTILYFRVCTGLVTDTVIPSLQFN